MDSVVKYFLSKNKVLLQYVYDEFGFKYACVAAVGPGRIGWSMCHHTEDSILRRMKPHQLPRIQRLALTCESESEFAMEMLNSHAYKRLMNANGYVRVPQFKRERAIEEAVNRALADKVWVEGEVIDQTIPVKTLAGEVPFDEQVVSILFQMDERSRNAKW